MILDDFFNDMGDEEALDQIEAEFGLTELARDASDMYWELRGRLSPKEALEEVIKFFMDVKP